MHIIDSNLYVASCTMLVYMFGHSVNKMEQYSYIIMCNLIPLCMYHFQHKEVYLLLYRPV